MSGNKNTGCYRKHCLQVTGLPISLSCRSETSLFIQSSSACSLSINSCRTESRKTWTQSKSSYLKNMESYFGEHIRGKRKTILFCMWRQNFLLGVLHFTLKVIMYKHSKNIFSDAYLQPVQMCVCVSLNKPKVSAYWVCTCVFRLISSSSHALTETNGFWSHASLWHSYQYFSLTSTWPRCSCWHRDNVITYWGLFMGLSGHICSVPISNEKFQRITHNRSLVWALFIVEHWKQRSYWL